MTQGQAQVFQIVVGKVRKYLEVNIIVGERPRILAEAKSFEPLSNIVRQLVAPQVRLESEILCAGEQQVHRGPESVVGPACVKTFADFPE